MAHIAATVTMSTTGIFNIGAYLAQSLSGFNFTAFGFYDTASGVDNSYPPTANSWGRWNNNTAADSRFYLSGVAQATDTFVSVTPDNISNLTLHLGPEIGTYVYIYALAGNEWQQIQIPLVPATYNDPTPNVKSGTDVVAAAYALLAAVSGTLSPNGCHEIARTIAAMAGAPMPINSGSITPSANEDGGHWTAVYRGNASVNMLDNTWLTMLQPGDIVRADYADPAKSQHTFTVLETSGTSVRSIDNATSGGLIQDHWRDYGSLMDARSVTIYRITEALNVIYGTTSDNTLVGTLQGDKLLAYEGNDALYSGVGDDQLSGGPGSNTIDGGSGNDTVVETGIAGLTLTHTSQTGNGWLITGTSFSDQVTNVESAVLNGQTYTLRQTKSDFNFGAASGDVGSTSDLLLYNSVGQFVTYDLQGSSNVGAAYLGQAYGWAPVATGDFNGDGISDFISQNNGFLLNYRINSAGNTQSVTYLAYVPGWSVVGTGDFNNDGRLDLVLQNGGSVIDWLMGANGSVTGGGSLGIFGSSWSVVGVNDFNGDHIADTLIRNSATGEVVEWLTGANAAVATVQSIGTLASATVVGTGDFNGDGLNDVLLRDLSGNYSIWGLGADGKIAAVYNVGAAPGFSLVGTGDYNGDGTADIMLQSGGALYEWQMYNGSIAVAGYVTLTGVNGWTALG